MSALAFSAIASRHGAALIEIPSTAAMTSAATSTPAKMASPSPSRRITVRAFICRASVDCDLYSR
jgi:hypothetical protein